MLFSALPPGWTISVAEAAPNQPPAGPRYPLAFEPFLYFESGHQALQRLPRTVCSFFLEDEVAKLTKAQLFVVLDWPQPGQASSPGHATFGGVQLAPDVPTAALDGLLAEAELQLQAWGQQALTIREYPFCYDPAGGPLLAVGLASRRYEVVLEEQNYYLDLRRSYEDGLHPSARRRLARCQRAGLMVEQESPLFLPLAYEFIAACRAERKQPALSLPLQRLQELFALYPRQYFLLSVREPQQSQWVAITVAIQASRRVLHNFYPASPLAFNHLSPAVLLTAGLHSLGQALGAEVLDLGRSTLNGREPHESLLRFKRHLGGLPSAKLTWYKSLTGAGRKAVWHP